LEPEAAIIASTFPELSQALQVLFAGVKIRLQADCCLHFGDGLGLAPFLFIGKAEGAVCHGEREGLGFGLLRLDEIFPDVSFGARIGQGPQNPSIDDGEEAVLAPMPVARVRIETAAKPELRRRERSA
jgi:hypothetical protein